MACWYSFIFLATCCPNRGFSMGLTLSWVSTMVANVSTPQSKPIALSPLFLLGSQFIVTDKYQRPVLCKTSAVFTSPGVRACPRRVILPTPLSFTEPCLVCSFKCKRKPSPCVLYPHPVNRR